MEGGSEVGVQGAWREGVKSECRVQGRREVGVQGAWREGVKCEQRVHGVQATRVKEHLLDLLVVNLLIHPALSQAHTEGGRQGREAVEAGRERTRRSTEFWAENRAQEPGK